MSERRFYIPPALLEAFSGLGANSTTAYTTQEIGSFTKICLSRLPYNCEGTPLGKALGVNSFYISELPELLKKCVEGVSPGRDATRHQEASTSQGVTRYTTFYLPIPTVPEPLSDPETVYSYQGYETTEKTDSDTSLSSSYSHHTEDVAGIEYEPVSAEEEDNKIRNSNSSDSDIETMVVMQGVDEHPGSNEDYFADESDASAEESDLSGYGGHKWPCLTCGFKQIFCRYCLMCWESRKEWYPKHSKKRKKEKTFRIQPRNRTSRMTICPFPSSNGRDLNHPLLDRLVGLQRRFIHTKYLRRLHGRGKPMKWKDLPKEVPLPGTFKNMCWMTIAPFAITDLKMPP